MTMTSKQVKEWDRRIRKMQKHVDALREIDNLAGDDRSLDEIQGALNDIGERHQPAGDSPRLSEEARRALKSDRVLG